MSLRQRSPRRPASAASHRPRAPRQIDAQPSLVYVLEIYRLEDDSGHGHADVGGGDGERDEGPDAGAGAGRPAAAHRGLTGLNTSRKIQSECVAWAAIPAVGPDLAPARFQAHVPLLRGEVDGGLTQYQTFLVGCGFLLPPLPETLSPRR